MAEMQTGHAHQEAPPDTQPISSRIKISRPNQRLEDGFFGACQALFSHFIRHRELVGQLYRRDLLANYKKSFIGALWIVLTPIIGIISWVFMHYNGLLNPGESSVPYPAFLLIGTSVWGLFMSCYTSAGQTLTAAKALVLQVNFPREVFLFEKMLLQLTNFGVALLLNLVLIFLMGVTPSPAIVLFPLVVAPLILLAAGIGLIAAILAIVAEDFNKLMSTFIGMTFWVTPVIYSERLKSSWAQSLVTWNPLTYLVCSARDIILYGKLYEPNGYWLSSALAILFFLFAWRVFYVSEARVIERMM